ncbi:EAL domain-containing protein [Methylomonas sp. UP202]|uniref:bifunctional diguanylate cyclase/phosphodiesterase n=1 Tax=Methylomonas sp. UP202 TaxID=3040943 RepID=UPI00247A7D1D|nr:EAL domain-containing protein [Methylomonas sp. UP202]WGS88422.1 EAL domain-containing protein [Methylomonas sp. UP202]
MVKALRSPGFTTSLWLTFAVFVGFTAMFTLYVRSEKAIDRANDIRIQSVLLAGELRQSSDDLTHMARSYVVTGHPIYKQHYQEILDIRDGKAPRPVDYQNVYWDLVLADDRRPRPSEDRAAPLLDLMRTAGFSDTEMADLALAKTRSDALTAIERAAMALVDQAEPIADPTRMRASQMVHDAAYHQAKAAIMEPIGSAYQMVENRTRQTVNEAISTAMTMRIGLIALAALQVLTLLFALRNLNRALGVSVEELHSHMVRIGGGDFRTAIPLTAKQDNSVIAWLADMQCRLASLEAEQLQAEMRARRLTQLYAALSQCNQAIVRCANQEELFPIICRDAVLFGGMTMAWIGLVDESARTVKPVAGYGDSMDYLNQLEISIDPNLPSGRGPTGIAIREDRPYWCQDFQNDPNTATWRDRATECYVQASAALPLHRDGRVIGSFNLYSGQLNAFDDDARNLLLEMAMDIDYALMGFDREEERRRNQQAEQFRGFMLESLNSGAPLSAILINVVTKLESIIADSRCSVLLLDEATQQLRLAAAPNLPEFYNQAVDGLPIGAGVGACGNTAYTGQRTIVADIQTHPYWAAYRDIARHADLGCCWSEPILANGNRVLGTFAIYRSYPAEPDRYHLQLLQMAADFVTLAIERKKAEDDIYFLANFDPLTGLPNRARLNEHLKLAISIAKRTSGHLALMFLDLDHFKDINDTLGHTIGDALLIELARRLKQVLRDEDTITRLGGDEFIFLLPGTDATGAGWVAQKLLDTIAATYRIDQYDLTLTASIGIAIYPGDGDDLEALSRCADTAMYRAKQEGRHGARFFTPEMQASSARNLQLLNALRSALERDELTLHYQPQIAADTQHVIGAEALLRWRNPELGLVSPAEFIPLAEESGLILSIGEWVIRTAARQAEHWRQSGFPPFIMAVNVSAAQFKQPELPELVADILHEVGLPAEYLELELTEGVAMHNPQGVIAMMAQFHERGIRMSIDDFGTGYSSLSYLKKFKVYKLKIDQSFVRDLTSDQEDKAIVAAVISLAKSLGLKTIAEGVETVEQLDYLHQQGCDEMQGYLFSKPLPAEAFTDWLRAHAEPASSGD